MANALSLNKTWAGFFAKKVEDYAVVGAETYIGTMFRLDDPANNVLMFKSENLRLGAGVGGAFSVGTIIFFNVGYNLGWIEEQSLGHGWGLTADLPVACFAKSRTMIKAFNAVRSLYGAYSQIKELGSLAAQLWEAASHTSNNPIIHIATENSVTMSAGLMRSFGGKIDILVLRGKGGITYDF